MVLLKPAAPRGGGGTCPEVDHPPGSWALPRAASGGDGSGDERDDDDAEGGGEGEERPVAAGAAGAGPAASGAAAARKELEGLSADGSQVLSAPRLLPQGEELGDGAAAAGASAAVAASAHLPQPSLSLATAPGAPALLASSARLGSAMQSLLLAWALVTGKQGAKDELRPWQVSVRSLGNASPPRGGAFAHSLTPTPTPTPPSASRDSSAHQVAPYVEAVLSQGELAEASAAAGADAGGGGRGAVRPALRAAARLLQVTWHRKRME